MSLPAYSVPNLQYTVIIAYSNHGFSASYLSDAEKPRLVTRWSDAFEWFPLRDLYSFGWYTQVIAHLQLPNLGTTPKTPKKIKKWNHSLNITGFDNHVTRRDPVRSFCHSGRHPWSMPYSSFCEMDNVIIK